MQPICRYIAGVGVGLLLSLQGCSSVPEKPAARALPAHADTERRVVIAGARDMLGKPYRFGGRDPRGFDCSGLVWYTHRQAGIEVPRTARSQLAAASPVARGALQAGDLLFFRIGARRAGHVGIYIGGGKFIHAPSGGKRVAAARLGDRYWSQRLIGAGHFYRSRAESDAPLSSARLR